MQWFIKMRALLLLLFIALSFSVTAQVTPPFPRTDSNTAVSDYNLFVPWTLDVPHGIDTATSHALKAGLDSLGLIYFDNVHHLLYIRDSIGSTHYWKAIPIGSPGAVTSFNTRTGAITLVAGDVTTALGGTPLLAANNLSDLTNIATARTNLGLSTLAATGQWSDVQNKPTTLAGYGITDPVVLTTGSYSNPSWITSLAFSKITGYFSTDNLDSVLARGDTAHNKVLLMLDGSGKRVFNVDPANHFVSLGNIDVSNGTFISVDDGTGTKQITIQADSGIQFIGNVNALNYINGQASQFVGDHLKLPNTGNTSDTLATKFDVRSNASTLDAVLAAGNTANGKTMLLNDGAGDPWFNFDPTTPRLELGDVSGATSGGEYIVINPNDALQIHSYTGLSLQLNAIGIGTSPTILWSQLAHNDFGGTNLHLPNTHNADDTLVTFSDLRAASGSGSTNLNIGSGFRFAVPGTNNIKTLFATQGIVADSSSNSSAITLKGDTNYLVRYNDTTGSGTNTLVTRTHLNAQNYLSTGLTSGEIWIGNVSNIAAQQTPSGDWTINNAGVATIGNNVVSNAKFRQSTANKLVGNPTGSTANVTDIELGFGLGFSSGNLVDTATHLSSYINDIGAGDSSFTDTVTTITNGTSSTVPNGTNIFIFNPTGTIASYTLTLPATPSISHRLIIQTGPATIGIGTAVTNLTVTSSSTIEGITVTSFPAPATIVYDWIPTLSYWHRLQ